MQLNLIYDPSADDAPAGFQVALAAAAQYLDTLITNPITVNITVGYGEDDGMPLTDGESSGGPADGIGLSYAQVVQFLTANISSAPEAAAVASLPTTDPTGSAEFYVTSAEEKAWGLLPADGSEIDGTVGFSSDPGVYDFDPNDRAEPGLVDFVGVAEHELTHALSRLVDTGLTTVMDLYRFAAPGVRELVAYQPAYFSLDNGATDLADYDTTSDPGDWSATTGPDSFDAYSATGVENPVTPVDITEMNVLGFSVDTAPSTVTAYTVADEADLNGALAAIRFSAANLTYTITLVAGLPGNILAVDSALAPVTLPSGATLFIIGGGQTIDGGDTQGGFSVTSGSVAIEDLTIAGMVRFGGAGAEGAGGGGGGAGEGGGLFVGSGAAVTLSDVVISGGGAVGGAGGAAVDNDDGGNGGGANGGVVNNGASLSNTAGGVGGDGEGGGGGGNAFLGPASGPGGTGGFGGGGGGGGYFQVGVDGLGGVAGFGGGNGGLANGAPGENGGGGGGGAGMGAGGDVFVAPGGVLNLQTGVLGAGVVAGGLGGAGGTQDVPDAGYDGSPGDGFGSGIFMAGTQQIALNPPAGQTLTITGAIVDQTGSGGTGANAASGSLALEGAGTVRLAAANDYTGGTFLEPGATLDLAATGAAGGNAIVFESEEALRIETGVTVPNVLFNFGTGDMIDFVGVASGTQPGSISIDAGNRLIVSGSSSASVQLERNLTYVPDWFHATIDPGGIGTTVSYVACFAAGTRIDTVTGPAPVERLRVGDMVLTARGAPRRVVWLGHRAIDCCLHPRPVEVWPVRIKAGAFGSARPRRDLWLSPDHAVLTGRMLIPIRYLVNGATINQQAVDTVNYWHVELERHDVLLAEGLPCESYLDTGNRGTFANGDDEPAAARPAWLSREIALAGPYRRP